MLTELKALKNFDFSQMSKVFNFTCRTLVDENLAGQTAYEVGLRSRIDWKNNLSLSNAMQQKLEIYQINKCTAKVTKISSIAIMSVIGITCR